MLIKFNVILNDKYILNHSSYLVEKSDKNNKQVRLLTNLIFESFSIIIFLA